LTINEGSLISLLSVTRAVASTASRSDDDDAEHSFSPASRHRAYSDGKNPRWLIHSPVSFEQVYWSKKKQIARSSHAESAI
jgi:hypothetical protein